MMKLHKRSGDITGPRPRGRRRLVAVATLPALVTLGNLLAGFGAIYCAMLSLHLTPDVVAERSAQHGTLFQRLLPSHLAIGAYLLFVAMLCDALDGQVARLTRRTSDFGGQLDSLADMVSFSTAPAVLMLCLVMGFLDANTEVWLNGKIFWRLTWVAAAVYVSCGALRLARFNVENSHDESAHRYFKGLPTPGAAAGVATLIILHEEVLRVELAGTSQWLVAVLPIATLALGLAMVSRVPYVHFLNVYLRGRRPVSHLAAIIVLVILISLHPQLMMAAMVGGYALSGPIAAGYKSLTRPTGADAAGDQPIAPPSQDKDTHTG